MSTISPAELALRVRGRGLRLDERLARSFLEDWRRRGVAEERAGRWRLTKRGQAMFAGWASEIERRA